MASSGNLASRIRGAILGLAVCDALGAPVEFKARGRFPLVTEMLPNESFNTPAGAFTDDTSMAMCLAHSLVENEGKHNAIDQAEKYLAWSDQGFMSSVGYCFDIGVSTRLCLRRWQELINSEIKTLKPGSPTAESAAFTIEKTIRHEFRKEVFCGNGSLMRVLPTALMASSVDEAAALAFQSSLTTHPHARCTSACGLYARLVFLATQISDSHDDKESLALDLTNMVNGTDMEVEQVLKQRLAPYKSVADWFSKPVSEISSSGYVVDSLEASLWAFFTTDAFEEGAIKVVNLGDDADTVGAIYGGLAGAFYGAEAIPDRWLSRMKRKDLLDDVITKVIAFRQGLAK